MTKQPFWKERMDICNNCDRAQGRGALMRCKSCGCFLEAKTKVFFMHCPLEKW